MAPEICDFYAGDGPPLAPDKNGQTLAFHRCLSTTLSSLLVGHGPELVCQLVVGADYDLDSACVCMVFCRCNFNFHACCSVAGLNLSGVTGTKPLVLLENSF